VKAKSTSLIKRERKSPSYISTDLIIEMQTVVVIVTAYTEQYFNGEGTSSIKKCFQQYLSENPVQISTLEYMSQFCNDMISSSAFIK